MRPAIGENLFRSSVDAGGVRNVHGESPRLATERADFCGDLLGIFHRAGHDDNIRAFSGEFQGDGTTDSTSCAGDDCDLIGEYTHVGEIVMRDA